jgi:MFS family permease
MTLLRDVTFRRFWVGQIVSLVGDQVSLFAVPLTAVLVLRANPTQMGLLTAAGLLPSLLFSLAAGAAIDRHGRRRQVMLAADLGRALLTVTIPVSYVLGRLGLPQLFAVTFAVGSLDVLFFVAYTALFVSVVPRDRYVEGGSLLNGSRAMSVIVGQSGAGLLVAAFTAPGAIVLDALTFLVSALTLARIRPVEPPMAEPGKGQLIAGVRFIAGSPIVRSALGATATVNFFTFALNAIMILYATQSLSVRPAVLGLVLGVGAVGGVVGSLVTGRVTRRIGIGPTFIAGCVLFPAPLALIPAAGGPHTLVLMCLLAAEFGSGVGVMLLDIAGGAIFAGVIPHELRSRVSGAYRTVNYGVRPLGALTGGLLGGAIGLRPTLWLAVAGAVTCALWLVRSPLPALRELEQEPASSKLVRASQC